MSSVVAPVESLMVGDCLDVLRQFPDNHFDLIFCSPPYENCRSYGIGFDLRGQDWVDWAVERYIECTRVCRGLVAWVVEGKTKNFRWSATPALMIADLHRRGVRLRKPPIFHRVGIPGGGGPDWWRNDYEFIVCSSKGRLPWSDNLAAGHEQKYKSGGALSHRKKDGSRIDGKERLEKVNSSRHKLANPGNVLHLVTGGGHLGSRIAEEQEAPFPEALVDPFVRCFCPPGGIVGDIFCGSGTVAAVAIKTGRRYFCSDIREDQIELTRRRIDEARSSLPERGIVGD